MRIRINPFLRERCRHGSTIEVATSGRGAPRGGRPGIFLLSLLKSHPPQRRYPMPSDELPEISEIIASLSGERAEVRITGAKGSAAAYLLSRVAGRLKC